jgi:expansin (peptidoglycan-binding protein)
MRQRWPARDTIPVLMPRSFTFSLGHASIALTWLLAAGGCVSNNLPATTSSAGGTLAMGGTSAVSAGGAESTGGVSQLGLGGASSTSASENSASGGTSALSNTAATKTTGGSTTIISTGGASSNELATGGASSTAPTGLPSSCSGMACNAATTVNPQLTSYGALGNVTMYTTSASSGGACLYGVTQVMYFAAINVNLSPGDAQGQWQGGSICGQCMEVTTLTTEGPKSAVVRIMDKCPDGYCGIDLGGSAPAALMPDGMGRYEGAWRAVSCAGHPEVFDGDPSIYVKDGASSGWSVIQVRNPMTAVAGIDYENHGNASQTGTLVTTSPSIENFFSVPIELLQANAKFDFTVRYVDGTSGTVSLTSDQLGTAAATYAMNQ